MQRRIAVFVHALHGGGAERVAAQMANLWVDRGYQVTLITLDTLGSDHYPVAAGVRRRGLGVMRDSPNPLAAVVNNLQRVRKLRDALREVAPHCVISVTDRMNILALLATRGLDIPVIAAEHSDPRHQDLGRVWERLRRWTYPRAAAIVVLTEAVRQTLQPLAPAVPIHVIPNGIESSRRTVSGEQLVTQRRMVTLGRLSREKGFDLLIEAFAQVAAKYPQWELLIGGEGPERESLEHLVAQRELTSRVRLLGWVDEPEELLEQASIFVLPSRYEGFPVALLEAMACGLPVVSFDCDSGPREIVRHEQDGLLVPPLDVAGLTAALGRLMSDANLRQRLGAAAVEVRERFSAARFADCWDRVVEQALAAATAQAATSRQS